MSKSTEKSKERVVKKLREQVVKFKDNPEKLRRVQGRLATVESQK